MQNWLRYSRERAYLISLILIRPWSFNFSRALPPPRPQGWPPAPLGSKQAGRSAESSNEMSSGKSKARRLPNMDLFLRELVLVNVQASRLSSNILQRSFFFFARMSCSEQSAFHGQASDRAWFFSELLFQSVVAKKKRKKVMFKVFLNFIFQPHWRYSERGAGLARWRDCFDNTPKKVLSEKSVIQKSIIKTDYQNGRPKKYY